MSEGGFTRRIEDMRQRVATLRQLPGKSPLQQQAVLTEALEKLETALEELQVVEEELVSAHEEIEVERQRYQELFDFAPDGYLVTDREGKIREANRAAARLLNVSHQFLVGKSLLVFVDREERHAFYSQLTRLFQGRGLEHQLPWEDPLERQEWELRLRPGQSYQRVGLPFEASLTAAPVRSSDGQLVTLRWLIRDITKHKQIEAQLRHNAFHDALTGLPNRDLFMDRLGRAVEHAKRHKNYWFAVLFLDLDRFKMINDNLGHTLGDQFLITTARRLEACLRPTDTAARLGGDEFTVLLEDIKGVSDAIHVAQRIQEQLTLPFDLRAAPIPKGVAGRPSPSTEDLTWGCPNPEVDPHEVFTSASIGIAFSAGSYQRPEDLLRDADIAMYRAKELGKARCEIFNTDMYTDAIARLQLENDLRRAIERREFRIHYQPIVTLETGIITGFEALIRWQRPTSGDLIYPGEFMPAARETGLSIAIDRWVFREACRQIQEWQAELRSPAGDLAGTDPQGGYPALTMSVNFCSRHFMQPDLLQYIEQVLQETGLEAHSLKLEITESVLIENTDTATNTLLQLQALGVQVCLDDFGTGYSSLSYLHRFPINTLKIDRSFISNMIARNENLEIVRAIVKLAKTLSMDVVAEGVETAEQLVQLRELKCGSAQGYYFSKPLEREAAGAFVKENLIKTTN